MQELQGIVRLAAGYHAIEITYFNSATPVLGLTVSYSGPGITKIAIPGTALFHPPAAILPAVNPGPVVAGLYFKAFEGTWTVLPM